MATWDGTSLFYRSWPAKKVSDKAIVLFHRGHEHSGRMQEIVDLLDMEGFHFFAWDARGNGNSEGPRDYAENLGCYTKDMDVFIRHIQAHYDIPVENMVIIGHSMGAAVVAAWVHDYAPRIRAMVLGAPAFRIRLYVPFAIPLLRLAWKLGMMKFVPSYVKARLLTHDREQIEKYTQDEMITHRIATNILLDLHDTSARILRDARAVHVPCLVLAAGRDWIVKTSVAKDFFRHVGSEIKEWGLFPGFYHDIFHEKERRDPVQRTRAFIEKCFKEPVDRSFLRNAHKKGYTKEEYNELMELLSPLTMKNIFYKIMKLMMKTVGRLSRGIRLGWKSGFNSGRTLDYVYENKARGIIPFGGLIDRLYLNGVGWKGIRMRKMHMERFLKKSIESIYGEKGEIYLLDIAAGAGRYVLETLKEYRSYPIKAELRDFEERNLEEGRKLAEKMSLPHVQFVAGDAFDREALASFPKRPNIVIVSGLYELFDDNDKIMDSLLGIATLITTGGLLLYTNQPWHPQLEFIARALVDQDGRPWVMRRRTQFEMDELVRQAGFEKVDMAIDPMGIFTVSCAKRTREKIENRK